MEPLAAEDPIEIAGYRLRARLGAGGMGRVYLAFTAGGRPVALKIVRPELVDDQGFRSRFRQEVTAARRVHGLYTAQVLDADPDASPPWLVTAYVPGPSLQQAVDGHGPLPPDTVLLLMAGIAEALQVIHGAGLVHRDLKPSNVLLAADGPRVIDFGIARAADATTVTRTGMRIGSPGFMAPEQAEGLPATPAIDVFALGSVATYAALGRTPFGLGNDVALLYRIVHQPPDLEGCPPALRGLIERCLAKSPAQRPAPGEIIDECRAHTAGQTLQIAQAWLPATVSADLAGHAPPPSPYQPARQDAPATLGLAGRWPGPGGDTGAAAAADDRRARRGRWLRVLAALIVAAGIGAGLAPLLRGGSGSGPGTSASGAGHGAAAGGAARSSAAASASSTSASSTSAARPAAPLERPGAGTRPRPSPSPAACLTGTWRSVRQQLSSSINGQEILFTGSGAISTVRPDGRDTTVYADTVFSADVNGVTWTQTFRGTTGGHWAVQNGDILFSDISSAGTVVLRQDGVYDSGGALEGLPGAVPYTCSGNLLREYFPNAGSDELVRVTRS